MNTNGALHMLSTWALGQRVFKTVLIHNIFEAEFVHLAATLSHVNNTVVKKQWIPTNGAFVIQIDTNHL